jgi:hypothetical protein
MQRRAAAAYVAFFLVIAAGSYGVIATTENPEAYVTEEEAEYTLVAGESIEVGERTYSVSEVKAEEAGGGVEYSATLTRINESAVQTESWARNTTVTYDNSTYRVLIANVSDPSEVQLRPEPPDDVNPRWYGDRQYVDFDLDDDGFVEQNVSVVRYLETEENRSNVTFSESLTVNGTERSVTSLTNASVTFEWVEPEEEEVSFGQAELVELNGQQYLAYFENGETVYLDANDSTAYYQRQADHDAMRLRLNGFWAVTIVSVVSGAGLIGLAFLPRRE